MGAAMSVRRQPGRGDLVEQRLEQVMVLAVDERHPHPRMSERARGEEPAEPAPHDDDVPVVRHARSLAQAPQTAPRPRLSRPVENARPRADNR